MSSFVFSMELPAVHWDNKSLENLSRCVFETFRDNPADPITYETEQLLTKIKGAVVVPLLFLVGVVSIPVSLAAFGRQGLHNRINLCLFSLELVNLVNVTFLFVLNSDTLYTPLDVVFYGSVYQFLITNRLLGMLGFMYGAVYLSLLVSCERCLSVLFPLRAKVLFSTRATLLLIIIGTSCTTFPFFLIAASYEVVCVYDVLKQKMSIAVRANEFYFDNEALVNSLEGVYFGIVLSLGVPVLVLVSTAITGVKLRQTLNFRLHTSSAQAASHRGKETAVTKMLIALSVEFLVLSLASMVVRMVPLFNSELSVAGSFRRSFHVLFNAAEATSMLNSSINFFVYYTAGTKFRQSVRAMFCCCRSSELARALTRLFTGQWRLMEDNRSLSSVIRLAE